MPYVCPLCKILPSSHSLTKLSERKGIQYYYTCPSQALLYYDVNGILNHYDGLVINDYYEPNECTLEILNNKKKDTFADKFSNLVLQDIKHF